MVSDVELFSGVLKEDGDYLFLSVAKLEVPDQYLYSDYDAENDCNILNKEWIVKLVEVFAEGNKGTWKVKVHDDNESNECLLEI